MVRPIAFDVPARYPRALTAHVYKATASRYDPTLCHVTRSPGAHTLPRRFLSLFYTHLFPIFSLFRFRLLPFLSLLPILVPFPITSSHSSLLSSQISLFLLFSPVLASITLIFLIIISNLTPPYIPYTALLFFFAFTFLFYFHDLIRRRRRSTCIVHSLAAGSRWEAKPSITPNPLEFLSRACVQWNDTRRVRIHSARTTRRAAFIRNTDVQHDKCVKANKTRVYISFEIGVPLILIELYTSLKTVFFAVERILKCVGHTCTYAYNKCKWTCANRIAGVAKGQTERS